MPYVVVTCRSCDAILWPGVDHSCHGPEDETCEGELGTERTELFTEFELLRSGWKPPVRPDTPDLTPDQRAVASLVEITHTLTKERDDLQRQIEGSQECMLETASEYGERLREIGELIERIREGNADPDDIVATLDRMRQHTLDLPDVPPDERAPTSTTTNPNGDPA
jgi:hypothetical protein